MNPPVTIVMAEDNDDEFYLAQRAFDDVRLNYFLVRVRTGADLLDFLLARGKFKERVLIARSPCLILLDLEMPVMGGRETLRRLKGDASLRKLPVIMVTGSESEEEVLKAYDLGANSFIRKPFSFAEFLRVVTALKLYWLEIVQLPSAVDLPGPRTSEPAAAKRTWQKR